MQKGLREHAAPGHWSGKKEGNTKKALKAEVPGYDVMMLRLTAKKYSEQDKVNPSYSTQNKNPLV